MSRTNNQQIDLQEELLNRIIQRYDKRSEAVRELSEHFDVGRDAIYRRLRGDTLLTPTEILELAKKFNISLDAIMFQDLDTVFFSFNAFSREINSFEDYLVSLNDYLDKFLHMKDVSVYHNANDIPIWYYCFFPELISFKLYVWGRNIWDMEYLQRQKFKPTIIQPHAIELCESVLKKYLSISTTEMWSLNLFDNTLNQIDYYASTDGFENEDDAFMLIDRLEELAHHFAKMAEAGKKLGLKGEVEGYGDFTLYHNEMISTNNFIYLKSPIMKVLFTIYGSPNYLRSSDERICNYTEQWLEKIMARSTPIIENAKRSRNAFFQKGIQRRIDIVRRRIQSHFEDVY